jgi:hypothetical protein
MQDSKNMANGSFGNVIKFISLEAIITKLELFVHMKFAECFKKHARID